MLPSEILNTTPESEIVNTRVFDFSRELVFKAWSEPQYLKNWWGPAGFTNTFHEFDFRVGGRWRFTMHGPDKGNYENECEFICIEQPALIAWKRHSKPLFQIHATFEEMPGNRCKLTFKMLFETAEECAKLRPYVVDKNEENLDRLQTVLEKITSENT